MAVNGQGKSNFNTLSKKGPHSSTLSANCSSKAELILNSRSSQVIHQPWPVARMTMWHTVCPWSCPTWILCPPTRPILLTYLNFEPAWKFCFQTQQWLQWLNRDMPNGTNCNGSRGWLTGKFVLMSAKASMDCTRTGVFKSMECIMSAACAPCAHAPVLLVLLYC